MNRRLLLAALLTGCAHPLPPQRPPGVHTMATWDYSRRLSNGAPAPLPAPAQAIPPVTRIPPALPPRRPPPARPDTGMDLQADPANPYPEPDPTLPADVRLL